jgi:hypothetical protein
MASKKQCEQALDRYAEEISRLKNVVGLGIVPENEKGDRSEYALAVYVAKKLPTTALAVGELVPETVELPGRGNATHQIKTRVIEQGVVELEAGLGKEPLE